MGRNLPKEIISDAAANLHILRQTVNDEAEFMSPKEFNGLHIKLQKVGTQIKKAVPHSQWTNGKMERLFWLMKRTLKR